MFMYWHKKRGTIFLFSVATVFHNHFPKKQNKAHAENHVSVKLYSLGSCKSGSFSDQK